MVPGSTLMYGSSLRIETWRPRALRSRPTLAAVMPLPREEVTPPVTKTYFAMGSVLRGFFECYRTTRSPARREEQRDFVDVVMRRRAVRRFEEGGVERATIERIARLAQRTLSGGSSQGQRVIVIDRCRT